MLEKGKFYKKKINKKITLYILFFYLFSTNLSYSNNQQKLVKNLEEIKTLSFNFKQYIGDKVENGTCYIKYSFLLKCNYNNIKKKIIISNGKTVAIIKKKYKKIYRYPLKATALYFILDKKKILDSIRSGKSNSENLDFLEYNIQIKKKNKFTIFFDKKSLNLIGWQTKDRYANDVIVSINNLKINIPIDKKFFLIPKEEEL
mgnify:CR=1 FL=1|tara:strand:- start:80 stop:685 length:606 start_codon:yes stop_codon:yes gene_type:complete